MACPALHCEADTEPGMQPSLLSPTPMHVSPDMLHLTVTHLNTAILGFYKFTFKVNCILKEKIKINILTLHLNISVWFSYPFLVITPR